MLRSGTSNRAAGPEPHPAGPFSWRPAPSPPMCCLVAADCLNIGLHAALWPGITLPHPWPLMVQCAQPNDWPAGCSWAGLAWLSSSGGLQAATWEIERQAFDEKQQELRRQCARMRRERDELDRLLRAEKSKVACLPQQIRHGPECAGAHQLDPGLLRHSHGVPQRNGTLQQECSQVDRGALSPARDEQCLTVPPRT